jgi:hypothetical protein
VVNESVEQILQILPLDKRPWGVGARPNIGMNGSSLVYKSPVKMIADAQLPSLNAAVEMSQCGVTKFASSLPLGESGLVTMGTDGKPEYSAHCFDQFDLYQNYNHKSFHLQFNDTRTCIHKQEISRRNLIVIISSIGGATLFVLVIVNVLYILKRRRQGYTKI